jgi:hypothetical protein
MSALGLPAEFNDTALPAESVLEPVAGFAGDAIANPRRVRLRFDLAGRGTWVSHWSPKEGDARFGCCSSPRLHREARNARRLRRVPHGEGDRRHTDPRTSADDDNPLPHPRTRSSAAHNDGLGTVHDAPYLRSVAYNATKTRRVPPRQSCRSGSRRARCRQRAGRAGGGERQGSMLGPRGSGDGAGDGAGSVMDGGGGCSMVRPAAASWSR